MLKFEILLTPVSKKNSQQILINRATGRPFIAPSKKYKEYEKIALRYLPQTLCPIDYPVNVKAVFYMNTRRKCDLVNMQEALLDILVKAEILEDDNYSIVQSMDGSRVLYDKYNPRTEVEIRKITE